jgi:hypothetical protein
VLAAPAAPVRMGDAPMAPIFGGAAAAPARLDMPPTVPRPLAVPPPQADDFVPNMKPSFLGMGAAAGAFVVVGLLVVLVVLVFLLGK